MTEPDSTRHRAEERLTAWQRAKRWRSEYWRAVDKVRAAHAHEWPLYTFLPVPDAGKIIARIWRSRNLRPTRATVLAEEASALAGFAAWRVTWGSIASIRRSPQPSSIRR